MSARKKLSPHAERKEAARDLDRLVRARVELSRLEPGGTPERPREIATAAVVEVEATAPPCLRCDAVVRLEDHVVGRADGGLLRIATVRCPLCGQRRVFHFRIREPS